MAARFAVVDSKDLDQQDLRASSYVIVDGLPLHLHQELEKINRQIKRLKYKLRYLTKQAECIEAQREEKGV